LLSLLHGYNTIKELFSVVVTKVTDTGSEAVKIEASATNQGNIMNSKQVIEALKNGGYIVTECPKFGGWRLIRHEGDKGRKLSGVTYWAVWSAVKLTKSADGKETI
jgi:hypothetical protein